MEELKIQYKYYFRPDCFYANKCKSKGVKCFNCKNNRVKKEYCECIQGCYYKKKCKSKGMNCRCCKHKKYVNDHYEKIKIKKTCPYYNNLCLKEL